MGEFDVEAINPSIETIHVYNMAGYYIICSVLAWFMLSQSRSSGLESQRVSLVQEKGVQLTFSLEMGKGSDLFPFLKG